MECNGWAWQMQLTLQYELKIESDYNEISTSLHNIV